MVKSEPVTTSHHPDVPLHSMFLMHVPQDMQGTVPACSQLCAGLWPVPLRAGSLSPGETTLSTDQSSFLCFFGSCNSCDGHSFTPLKLQQ